MRIPIDHRHAWHAAILVLMIVLMAACITLYGRVSARSAEIDRLRAVITSIEKRRSDNTGGAETAPPAQQTTTSRFTFPIAKSDYLALTSPFGYRVSPILRVERYHQGVDVAATWRAQIVAAADGVVVEHWPPPDGYYRGHEVYGGMLVIEHDNGWRTLYAHLSETRVHTGWTVDAGQVIGRVGSTGRSRGAHLHFEIIDATGTRLNPLLYVTPRQDHPRRDHAAPDAPPR